MSVKKNFLFNSILLVSQYIIPLLIFPYVSRVFDVERIGLVNFADSIVNYFILFSTLGLTLTGIRETAKNRGDQKRLNKVFSELLFLHLFMTFFILIVYLVIIFTYSKFREHQILFFFGASKLLFNVFLIEWFYRGLENFKYITVRTIFIKIIYVICIFFLVKQKDDISLYFGLTCSVVVINGLINCWYARNFVKLTIKNINIRHHFKSFFTIGIYLLLNSMYTTFNVAYLGIVSSNRSVGYYTTSLKLYTIILGLFTSLNEVLVPRLSSLIVENDHVAFRNLISKSISYVSTFCFPIIACGITLAPQIIILIAGPGYEGAIICFRIMISLILIVGFAQILSNQILMSLKRDKDLAITSSAGAIIGLTLNVLLVPLYHEVGTSLVVLITELSVTILLYFYCIKHANIYIPINSIIKNLILSVPYFLICFLCAKYISTSIIVLVVASMVSGIYFFISQVYVIKNEIILTPLVQVNNRILNWK